MPEIRPEVIAVRFPSRLELLALLDGVTLSLCERMKFDGETTSQVSMSVIEAGTNAIQHGHHRDAALSVDVDFMLYPDRLEVTVRDTGSGFDLGKLNGDATSPEHLLDPRGRGIFIMRACMDQVEFDFSNGTVCHLVKRRPPATTAVEP
jgi:serine/threonine-protein kinase RsbW